MRIRRERFFKINDWQQIKRIEENVFSLEIGGDGRWWSIKLSTIPTALDTRYKTIIEQFTDRHIGSLFNALPYDLWNKTNFLKYDDVWKHLDIWLRIIPEPYKIDSYGETVLAESNNIIQQAKVKWWPYFWVTLFLLVETKYLYYSIV